jgi:hypothetical protein
MLDSAGSATVRLAVADCPPTVAEMVVVPYPVLVARPAATVATLGFEEVQLAEPVKNPVLPSLKVAAKVN